MIEAIVLGIIGWIAFFMVLGTVQEFVSDFRSEMEKERAKPRKHLPPFKPLTPEEQLRSKIWLAAIGFTYLLFSVLMLYAGVK